MPVPKRKRSKARRDKRFANKGIKPKQIASCSQCNAPIASHQVCKECGFYKGVKVLTTKVERSVKRSEVKQVKASKKPTSSESQTEE